MINIQIMAYERRVGRKFFSFLPAIINMIEKKIKGRKEVKENKVTIRKYIVLIVLITVIVLLIIFASKNMFKKENGNQNKPQENQYIPIEEEKVGQIDMKNTENAKIENGIKENISSPLLNDRKLGNLELTQINLVAKDGLSNFTAVVKNNASEEFPGAVAVIDFLKKDGSKYATFEVYIPKINSNAANFINASSTADLVNAYDFTIKLQ